MRCRFNSLAIGNHGIVSFHGGLKFLLLHQGVAQVVLGSRIVRRFVQSLAVLIFGQVKFDLEGVYHIEVSVDNVLKLRYPLPLRIVQQPGAPGQPRPTETQ